MHFFGKKSIILHKKDAEPSFDNLTSWQAFKTVSRKHSAVMYIKNTPAFMSNHLSKPDDVKNVQYHTNWYPRYMNHIVDAEKCKSFFNGKYILYFAHYVHLRYKLNLYVCIMYRFVKPAKWLNIGSLQQMTHLKLTTYIWAWTGSPWCMAEVCIMILVTSQFVKTGMGVINRLVAFGSIRFSLECQNPKVFMFFFIISH